MRLAVGLQRPCVELSLTHCVSWVDHTVSLARRHALIKGSPFGGAPILQMVSAAGDGGNGKTTTQPDLERQSMSVELAK